VQSAPLWLSSRVLENHGTMTLTGVVLELKNGAGIHNELRTSAGLAFMSVSVRVRWRAFDAQL
jgi:hypothetical protein